MPVVEGLADVFTDAFGEEVLYTSIATGKSKTIQAIWVEQPIDIPGFNVESDGRRSEVHVREEDVPTPKEGDTAKRVATGAIGTVCTPIKPVDIGIIALTLARD